MSAKNTLLQQPPQPGPFWVCPSCRGWFALRLVRTEADAVKGALSLYRCVKCEAEIEFADRHPPGVI
jgi:hypothetical protein